MPPAAEGERGPKRPAEQRGEITSGPRQPHAETAASPPVYSETDPAGTGRAPPGQPDSTGLAPGSVVGDYELLERIGEGGMGVVYRARHRSAERIVAVKLMHAARLDGLPREKRSKLVERFAVESRAAARLEHDHIVRVYDIGEVDGFPFYVMQYIEGPSLAALTGAEQLDGRRAAELIEPVARAVHFAHLHGVLHRDIKPQNILVDARQQRALVTDFGLAKLLEQNEGLTALGEVFGTPDYMAPEQCQDASAVTVQSDVYALGATLYYLLTGGPVFHGKTPLETVRQVLDQPPVAPRRHNPRVDRDLETICLRCLEKEPSHRYASAQALADDLGRYRRGEPVAARPLGRLARARRFCRRNPLIAALTTAMVFLFLVAVIAVTAGYLEATSALRTAQQQRQRAILFGQRARLAGQAAERQRRLAELRLAENHVRFAGRASSEPAVALAWLARGLQSCPPDETERAEAIRLHLGARVRQLHTLSQFIDLPQGPMRLARFSPNGRFLLTGGDDGAGAICRISDGSIVGNALPHPHAIVTGAFHPLGNAALIAGGPTARLWSVPNGDLLGEWDHGSPVTAALFSADGERLLTAGRDGCVRVWEIATGRLAGKPMVVGGPIAAMEIEPRGRTLLIAAAGNRGHAVQQWDYVAREPLAVLAKSTSLIRALDVSAGGRELAVAAGNAAFVIELPAGDIDLDAPAAGSANVRRLAHRETVTAVGFHGKERLLLSAGLDQQVRFWNLDDGAQRGRALPVYRRVYAAAMHPAGELFVTADEAGVRIWRRAAGPASEGVRLGHPTDVDVAEVDPRGRFVVTSSAQQLAIWNAADGSARGESIKLPARAAAVTFLADTGRFAVVLKNGRIRYWNAESAEPDGDEVQIPPGEHFQAFAPDGKTWLTLRHDGRSARIRDARSGKPVGEPLLAPEGRVLAAAYSPDGRHVVTGHPNGAVVWEIGKSSPAGKPLVHPGNVRAAGFSPDAGLVVTGSDDRSVRLWQRPAHSLLARVEHLGGIQAAAFSPDGRLGLTSTSDRRLWFWNLATVTTLNRPIPIEQPVDRFSFSHDSRMVMTTLSGGRSQLWDLLFGEPLGEAWPYPRSRFTAGGHRILSRDGADVWLHEPPAPLEGGPERITLRTRSMTGLQIDASGVARLIDPKRWRALRRQLDELENR